MKKVLLFIWQLPQNLLGLLLILVLGAEKQEIPGLQVYWSGQTLIGGVSLGNYRILRQGSRKASILHEQGHSVQSLRWGPLYLIVIGIPSVVRNIWDRLFHRKWFAPKRVVWYYKHFPEKQADMFGGVNR